MSAPKIVARVQHSRKHGHVAYLQKRGNESLARFGGERFASWARRTVNGQETGTPERFRTYPRRAPALAHAEYAASKETPGALELLKKGGRVP